MLLCGCKIKRNTLVAQAFQLNNLPYPNRFKLKSIWMSSLYIVKVRRANIHWKSVPEENQNDGLKDFRRWSQLMFNSLQFLLIDFHFLFTYLVLLSDKLGYSISLIF
jgi:hypothetical protein